MKRKVSMRVSMAAGSCPGKVRKNNEDQFLLNGKILFRDWPENAVLTDQTEGEEAALVAVFDGMGGHDRGEEAALIAARTAEEYARSAQWEHPEDALTDLCLEANQRIVRTGGGGKMGTTAVMLYLNGDSYCLCNIGDSPAFLLRDRMMKNISREHTHRAVYERINGPAEPGKKFPLTQYLGIPGDEMLIEPHTCGGSLRCGDMFLLCSDGVTDMLTREEILEVLLKAASPAKAVEALMESAMEKGGKDNITALCIGVEAGKIPTFWQRLRGKFL